MQGNFLETKTSGSNLVPKKADLHFQNGGSDKVYHAAIVPEKDGYAVLFAYGRRGDSLTRGSKTSFPVPIESAVKLFDKLISEKTGKGYRPSPGISGDVFPSVFAEATAVNISVTKEKERLPDCSPQLLTPITEDDDVKFYIKSKGYGAQEKKDGRRLIVKSDGKTVIGANRKTEVIELSPLIVKAVLGLERQVLLDGEAVGDVYHVFGMLELDGKSLRAMTYRDVHKKLQGLPESDNLRVVPLSFSESGKRKLFEILKTGEKEGIVFKHLQSCYFPGRDPRHIKCKFFATASVVVMGVNIKRSVSIGVFSGSALLCVGNVSVPTNYELPEKGDICEVRYLYAYPGGSLFQPTYLGERDDIDAEACTESQLKYVNKKDG